MVNKVKRVNWELKCPNCGFEFFIGFPDSEDEDFRNRIRKCPCGCVMDIEREEITEGKNV